MKTCEPSELTAAVLTAPGEGGISVIQVAGPHAASVVAGMFIRSDGSPTVFEPDRLYYGFLRGAGGEVLDEVIVACLSLSLIHISEPTRPY